MTYNTKVSQQKQHSLIDCIKNDYKLSVSQQQQHELYAIANDCVYLQDISELI